MGDRVGYSTILGVVAFRGDVRADQDLQGLEEVPGHPGLKENGAVRNIADHGEIEIHQGMVLETDLTGNIQLACAEEFTPGDPLYQGRIFQSIHRFFLSQAVIVEFHQAVPVFLSKDLGVIQVGHCS